LVFEFSIKPYNFAHWVCKKCVRVDLRPKAHAFLAKQIADLVLPAPYDLKCVDCGSPADHYHHYLGYRKKYWWSVNPVCSKCHRDNHAYLSVAEPSYEERKHSANRMYRRTNSI
jgi:hypothetical protein